MTTNKIGMRISIASPRPFFTPPITTMTQKNKNTVCQKISPIGSANTLSNTELADVPSTPWRSPIAIKTIYFKAHPAITA